MVRKCKIKGFEAWLPEKRVSPTSNSQYSVRLLPEEFSQRNVIFDELKAFVDEAHEDAKRKLRMALAPTLSPFASSTDDPAYGYPEQLHISTLMGYFGEVLAGAVAEHLEVHGKRSWVVPVFLFRFHQVAFQKLQVRRDLAQQGEDPGDPDETSMAITGRTGNDVLAFSVGDDNEIDGILICEAKCFSDHVSTQARKAYRQLGELMKGRCPTGVSELIDVLNDYSTPGAVKWCNSLRHLYLDPKLKPKKYPVLVYTVGNKPKKTVAWLPTNVPFPEFASSGGAGPLEIFETNLSEPSKLVTDIYRPQV